MWKPPISNAVRVPQQNRLAGQMKLQLVAMEVAPDPSLVEVEKAFSAMARTLMEHAKRFPRWMDGTCLSVRPRYIREEFGGL